MSKKGTSTFVIQRFTAVVLAPIAIWFLFGIVAALTSDYASARAWLAQPLNAILLSVMFAAGAWHMRIGMEEIIIDYIHSWLKSVLLLINWLVALGVLVAALWSIYNISFAG